MIPCLVLLGTSAHAQIANGLRAEIARALRVGAADAEFAAPLPENPDNNDEERYPSRFASYSKGLQHDAFGDVVTTEYDKLLASLIGGDPAAGLETLFLGERKLVNPLAGFSYLPVGPDPHALALRPAPLFTSAEVSGELDELYWMSLVRDVPFQDYTSSPPAVLTQAIQRLNQLREYRGAKEGGVVTGASLFRADLPGSAKGPFISQFLLLDVPYGAQVIPQRNLTRVPGDDRVFRFDTWLSIQNGALPTQPPVYDPVRRYLRNGRDLAEWVHLDYPVQSSLNAALLLTRLGDVDADPKSSPLVFDELNPYRNYRNQEPFATLGNGDGLDVVSRIVNPALRAQWFQKWLIHRRLRPEEYAGRVHNTVTGARTYPVPPELLASPVLPLVLARNNALNGGAGGTYLLNQAFPEGSPVHPAYASGHSTYIGAGVTMIKAFYKDLPIPNPVVPNADGTALVPYTGPTLYAFDELDKLVSNVGVARLFAGVHYRSDHDHGSRLGELLALRTLQDLARYYNEPFDGFQVRTFGGNTLTIDRDTPVLPNFVSTVDRFTLVNPSSGNDLAQVENGAVLDLSDLGTAQVALRATTYESQVGSVRFEIDGTVYVDNQAPYVLPITATVGTHVVTATPYSEPNGQGLGGVPLTVRVTVQP
ncbi:phosphoesterase [Corallococcus sp. AB049A]|uniref:Phosphoesterase n=1 Tax=Corallococcus interemptor TaxID=2316720 RepID=A0A3A8QC30_9BACT|nr:phosphoesterase [Corallococcus sp. AB050B]RKH66197.1 phosphoesterase [Corallococcus interemptor]RKI66188.1 phosphoesterase [Corallococcus sp. AB049A]